MTADLPLKLVAEILLILLGMLRFVALYDPVSAFLHRLFGFLSSGANVVEVAAYLVSA